MRLFLSALILGALIHTPQDGADFAAAAKLFPRDLAAYVCIENPARAVDLARSTLETLAGREAPGKVEALLQRELNELYGAAKDRAYPLVKRIRAAHLGILRFTEDEFSYLLIAQTDSGPAILGELEKEAKNKHRLGEVTVLELGMFRPTRKCYVAPVGGHLAAAPRLEIIEAVLAGHKATLADHELFRRAIPADRTAELRMSGFLDHNRLAADLLSTYSARNQIEYMAIDAALGISEIQGAAFQADFRDGSGELKVGVFGSGSAVLELAAQKPCEKKLVNAIPSSCVGAACWKIDRPEEFWKALSERLADSVSMGDARRRERFFRDLARSEERQGSTFQEACSWLTGEICFMFVPVNNLDDTFDDGKGVVAAFGVKKEDLDKAARIAGKIFNVGEGSSEYRNVTVHGGRNVLFLAGDALFIAGSPEAAKKVIDGIKDGTTLAEAPVSSIYGFVSLKNLYAMLAAESDELRDIAREIEHRTDTFTSVHTKERLDLTYKGVGALLSVGLVAGLAASMDWEAGRGEPEAVRLPPSVKVKPKTVLPADARERDRLLRSWVEKLGSDSGAERDEAETKLRGAGDSAVAALKDAVNSSDPEIRNRVHTLLAELGRFDLVPQAIEAVLGTVEGAIDRQRQNYMLESATSWALRIGVGSRLLASLGIEGVTEDQMGILLSVAGIRAMAKRLAEGDLKRRQKNFYTLLLATSDPDRLDKAKEELARIVERAERDQELSQSYLLAVVAGRDEAASRKFVGAKLSQSESLREAGAFVLHGFRRGGKRAASGDLLDLLGSPSAVVQANAWVVFSQFAQPPVRYNPFWPQERRLAALKELRSWWRP